MLMDLLVLPIITMVRICTFILSLFEIDHIAHMITLKLDYKSVHDE